MHYQIFLQSTSPHNFIAEVVGMSNLIAEGTTEAEAIMKIKASLENTLATGKFINIEVQQPENVPQMKFAGIFAEDQTFDDFMEKLTLIRQEANEVSD